MARELATARARRRYSAAGALIVVGLTAGGLALALPHHSGPHPSPVADNCGLVACGATLPAPASARPSPGAATHHRHSRGTPTSPAAKPRRHTPSPAPKPSPPRPTPSPTPSPSAPVAVSYQLQGQAGSHFQGLVTLTNRTGAAVAAWTLRLAFPGDKFNWAGPPMSPLPFNTWSASQGTLTLHAADSAEAIPPGGSEQITLVGHGSTTSPTSCSVNGASC